ncbi:hypothetical protein SDC9_138913 [bioreactor metagenome]|uniref:Uncharacterized protein n=1 Tax=bioreactor metagenome TaxID=1076179 RepID=A0A645DR97_9ZZZZ
MPIISITFVGLIVNINVKPKNKTEKITELIEEVSGSILISKVVAAVLGITSIGPRQSIIMTSKVTPNFLPAFPTTSWKEPALATAFIDNKIIPTSANTNPKKLIIQLLPDVIPIKGGKIKFPAPKNIEKRAKPIIIISLFLFIFNTSNLNFYI